MSKLKKKKEVSQKEEGVPALPIKPFPLIPKPGFSKFGQKRPFGASFPKVTNTPTGAFRTQHKG